MLWQRNSHGNNFLGRTKQRGYQWKLKSEVHRIKSTGDGTVYPSAEPWEALLGKEHPAAES